MARGNLTNHEWAVLAPLLLAQPLRGSQWRDHRQVINAICWVKRTGSPCVTYRNATDHGNRLPTIPPLGGRRHLGSLKAHAIAPAELDDDIDWYAQVDATIVRAHQHAAGARKGGATGPTPQAAQGIGRSRGGLTTKIHTLAEGRGRSLATRITPGQAADTRQLIPLLDQIRTPRPGGVGRPRKRPDSVTGDKAYSSRANRKALRDKGITKVSTRSGAVHPAGG
ncbi:transposase [Micromonospora sp. NPDC001898]|uniref:transposase n=1 Tax=Micromonospora sp. NPDC001898 TaxID=3364221 RepID=UPI00369FDD1A